MRNRLLPLSLVGCTILAAIVAGCNSTQVSSGLLYLEQDNEEKAVKMFREALWFNSEDAPAYFHLGRTLCSVAEDHAVDGELDSARIKLEEAHNCFVKAAELRPEEFGTTLDGEDIMESNISSNYARFFNQAVEYNNAGLQEDAIDYFQLAYAIDPRGVAGFNAKNSEIKLRFNIAASDNDTEAVTELLGQWEKIEPANSEQKADYVNTKANMLSFLGRDAEAGTLYEELLAENPDDLRLLTRVAQIRREAGDNAGAAELLERVMTLAAQDPEVTDEQRFNFAYSALANYRDAERYDEVLRVGQAALTLTDNPDRSYTVLYNIARAHYELEQWKSAITTAERAIALSDHKEEVWQVYYLSLSRDGRTDDAQEARARWEELRG